MPEEISLRLSPALCHNLQQAARGRGVSASALIRAALRQVLGQVTPAGQLQRRHRVTPGSDCS